MRFVPQFIVGILGGVLAHNAQSASPEAKYSARDPAANAERQTVIDDLPFSNLGTTNPARSLGSLETAVTNPANIAKDAKLNANNGAALNQLHFPLIGMQSIATNVDSPSTLGVSLDSNLFMRDAVLAAIDGDNQQYRFSLVPDFVIGRVLFAPIYDRQLSVVQPYDNAADAEFLYQQKTGFGIGTGLSDPRGLVSLGIFASSLQITRIDANYVASDFSDEENFGDKFDDNIEKFSGTDLYAGLHAKLHAKSGAYAATSVKHVGTSHYASSDKSKIKDSESIAGVLGVAPKFSNFARMNFAAGADDIGNPDKDFSEKWQVGLELSIGGSDIRPWGAVNAGASDVGVHAGALLNIGFIQLGISQTPVEIGANDNSEIQMRQNVIVSVDLAR